MAATRSNPDQFQLRLPPGLRDRIKAYADRYGRSMNAEIVRVLENEFPQPWPFGTRVSELLRLVEILKAGATEEAIDRLTGELHETLEGIASGRVKGVSDEVRAAIYESLKDWKIENWKEQETEYMSNMDEEEIDRLERTGSRAKFVDPTNKDDRPRRRAPKLYPPLEGDTPPDDDSQDK